MDFCDQAKHPWGLIQTCAQPGGLSRQVPMGTILQEDSSVINRSEKRTYFCLKTLIKGIKILVTCFTKVAK